MENFKIEKEILPVLEKLRYCGSVVPCYNCSYRTFVVFVVVVVVVAVVVVVVVGVGVGVVVAAAIQSAGIRFI